jgi:hypothetical protein
MVVTALNTYSFDILQNIRFQSFSTVGYDQNQAILAIQIPNKQIQPPLILTHPSSSFSSSFSLGSLFSIFYNLSYFSVFLWTTIHIDPRGILSKK